MKNYAVKDRELEELKQVQEWIKKLPTKKERDEADREYLKRIFKAVTGNGIMHYFLNLRIEKAKELLSEPANSVSFIADTLGFDSPQHFSGQFKKIVYMSPTAYRNAVFESNVLI